MLYGHISFLVYFYFNDEVGVFESRHDLRYLPWMLNNNATVYLKICFRIIFIFPFLQLHDRFQLGNKPKK